MCESSSDNVDANDFNPPPPSKSKLKLKRKNNKVPTATLSKVPVKTKPNENCENVDSDPQLPQELDVNPTVTVEQHATNMEIVLLKNNNIDEHEDI